MNIDWPSTNEEAERLYVFISHNIAIELQVDTQFGCNPKEVTRIYLKGGQWQEFNNRCIESLWEIIENIGMTNFEDAEAIRARFVLSLLPREDALDQEERLEWLLEFAEHLGISSFRLEESIEKSLQLFDRTNNF